MCLLMYIYWVYIREDLNLPPPFPFSAFLVEKNTCTIFMFDTKPNVKQIPISFVILTTGNNIVLLVFSFCILLS